MRANSEVKTYSKDSYSEFHFFVFFCTWLTETNLAIMKDGYLREGKKSLRIPCSVLLQKNLLEKRGTYHIYRVKWKAYGLSLGREKLLLSSLESGVSEMCSCGTTFSRVRMIRFSVVGCAYFKEEIIKKQLVSCSPLSSTRLMILFFSLI